MNAATLEAALAELEADDLDHLGYLLRERAARLRAAPQAPKPAESIVVPAEDIWEWVTIDMVRSGYTWRTAAIVVAELALDVDHLPAEAVADLLARALAELRRIDASRVP